VATHPEANRMLREALARSLAPMEGVGGAA
jgi:hypothetical protein